MPGGRRAAADDDGCSDDNYDKNAKFNDEMSKECGGNKQDESKKFPSSIYKDLNKNGDFKLVPFVYKPSSEDEKGETYFKVEN